MLLENKNAIVYGWGGSVGGAVSRAFAREGARVFLAGRTLSRVEAVAEEISAAGGDDASRRGQHGGVIGLGPGRRDDRDRRQPDQRHCRRLGTTKQLSDGRHRGG